MGLHIRHSLCKCSPSITKDIKYNDKNNSLIYIVISVQTIFTYRRNSKFCNNFKTVHLFFIIVKFANLECE